MATFITGAGLIGVYTARRLAEQGEQVTIYDAAPNMGYINAIVGTSAVKVVRGDVRDLPNLIAQSKGCQFFLHTAGLIGPKVHEQPFTGFAINVVGTVNAAEAARLNEAKRLVFCSTHGALNFAVPQTAPVTEDFPYGPTNLYGATKVSAEQLLLAYDRLFPTDYVMLRFPQVYGTGHYLGGSIGGESFDALIRNPWEGKPAVVKKVIAGTNEYLYVKDVAQAVEKVFQAPSLQHRIFNIGTGELHDIMAVIAIVKKTYPNAEFRLEEGVEATRGYRTQPYDISRAREELGYVPEWNLERGISDYFKELERTAPSLVRA